MRKIFISFFIVCFFLLSCKTDKKEKRDLILWYNQPAGDWTEALPVGNGRLGAMVFGTIKTEHIQLNEESVWTGGPVNRANQEAQNYLEEVRQLLFEGKYAEGDRLAQEKIMGTRLDGGVHTYQTLGDLFLQFEGLDDISNYKRELDLRNAVVVTTFESNGVKFTREFFSSRPDEVVVIKLSASKKGSLNFKTWLERPGDAETVSVGENQLLMSGFAEYEGEGTHFASIVNIKNNGGEVISENESLVVKNADEIEILISGRTDFWGADEVEKATADIKQAEEIEFEALKSKHIAVYQKQFNRVDLELNSLDTLNIPTDERLQRIKNGALDAHLAELYFQFGRYLLISSSQPDGLPANLQGIWEPSLSPPWNADYHININIQMNYWPSLVTNLAECQQPFFEFVKGLRERGSITAKEVYGCRGFVAHHTTDVWKFTDPIGMTGYGMWPMGAAWCSDHFWEYYEYTGDEQFLKKEAYPVLKEAALFFVDFLVENPKTGLLVSGPSMSPENKFITKNGEAAAVCMGPAMDHEIIRELFQNCIKASEILKVDAEFADTLKNKLAQLTPSQIGSDGRVLEWSEELPEENPGHRHISHLYALYPGEEFTNPDDPKWLEASRKTIEARLANGGGHTGWSRAWIINFYARLKDGKKAEENLQALLAKSTLPNLFDTHPPFQIDGNFGATAGIAEMLMQSHNGVLQILPALPPSWKSGEITGLRSRGGFEIDIKWEESVLKELKITSLLGKSCKIMYNGNTVVFQPQKGEQLILNNQLKKV
ncbi:glycoside hydrolase family 95 protein [Maribellus comscasis]|uniref:Glycoside hydrolase family 95 protein n=1 Tax=Maribellus comscasis TaxID=2681766 RepID=A0A6I6JNK1_9BACT|nr:glycoside hydrolase family 95 protein [Maribellus comscasis]QGY42648.1 glycoside hydrolase family 95 protein [Maribellus comscasis]